MSVLAHPADADAEQLYPHDLHVSPIPEVQLFHQTDFTMTTLSLLSPTEQRIQAVLHSRKGLPPFGYQWNPETKRHEPDPERFAIVKRLFELVLAGTRMRFVYAELAANPAFVTVARGSRGGRPIPRSNLYAILRDPFYAGMIEWEGRLYEGVHDAAVCWADFLEAARRTSRMSEPVIL